MRGGEPGKDVARLPKNGSSGSKKAKGIREESQVFL